jgi:hypothetical protein
MGDVVRGIPEGGLLFGLVGYLGFPFSAILCYEGPLLLKSCRQEGKKGLSTKIQHVKERRKCQWVELGVDLFGRTTDGEREVLATVHTHLNPMESICR